MKNKIVELLSDTNKDKVYTALKNKIPVFCTTNKRTAPNSIITECGSYIIGIAPKDLSYFDFEILPLEKMIDHDDVIMIKEYAVTNGYETGKIAFEQTPKFNNHYVNRQYTFDDVLSLSATLIKVKQ
jgi:hypothetical protein